VEFFHIQSSCDDVSTLPGSRHDLPPGIDNDGMAVAALLLTICPSSNDLRLFVFLKIGVSGSVWGLI